MWWLAGHLGALVSALVDGQLDEATAQEAWHHVATCESCRAAVERETWVKERLARVAGGEPPPGLLAQLQSVGGEAETAWEEAHDRSRVRRRAGFALAGAGSVSAAVIGLVAIGIPGGGPAASIGGTPGSGPTTSDVRPTPTATSRAPGSQLRRGRTGIEPAVTLHESR